MIMYIKYIQCLCRKISMVLGVFVVFNFLVFERAEDSKESKPASWMRPKIYIYQPPAVEVSTVTTFRTVDPQIIQKLIDLLQEDYLGKKEEDDPTDPIASSLLAIKSLETPEGKELGNRYTYLGVALSESLGWEQIKHIRVISEQNLKQRLTIVARWEQPDVRSIALVALATLKDKNDLVYFQEALWSRQIGVRYATVEALLKWGYPEAVPILQGLVDRDESFLIRAVAAAALAHLGAPNGISILRQNLDSKDWLVRALSAKALGEVGSYEDYDILVQQINREQISNSNEFVLAETAVAALKLFPLKIEKQNEEKELKKQRKKNPAYQPSIKKEAVRPRKDVLFELEPLVVKAPRLQIEQEIPVDSRIDFQLLKLLQEKPEMRVTDEMRHQSIAYNDLDFLVTPNGRRLLGRYTILGLLLTEGLAGTKDFQLMNELQRIARNERKFEEKNKQVVSFAMIALAYNKDPIHLSIFQDALRSESPTDRFASLEALSIWGLPEATSILIGVTKLDSSAFIRVYAAQAAWRMGESIGRDFILSSLNDQDWVARAMAMRYFGELGSADAYEQLLAYFASQQRPIVQAEMCSALLRLFAKKAEAEKR